MKETTERETSANIINFDYTEIKWEREGLLENDKHMPAHRFIIRSLNNTREVVMAEECGNKILLDANKWQFPTAFLPLRVCLIVYLSIIHIAY